MSFIIQVHLHTILQQETADGLTSQVDVDLAEGSVLGDLLKLLDIALDPDSLLLVINGRMAETDSLLSPGDVVHLMPAISGGASPHQFGRPFTQ